jgi:Fic family protein
MDPLRQLVITPEILRLIAELDEFKGRWHALNGLAADRLSTLRRVATIESVGSSTRIEGARLTDDEVEELLSRVGMRSFRRHGHLTMRSAVEATGANRNTLKTHLRKLVESGHLAQHGSGRGTWYGPW